MTLSSNALTVTSRRGSLAPRADARRKRRRAPTRVVTIVSSITHAITLATTAIALGAADLDTACAIIAVTTTLATVARLIAGALRFPEREIDICWLIFQGSFLFWFCLPGFTRAVNQDWIKESALLVVTPESFGYAWIAISLFTAIYDATYALARPGRLLRSGVARFMGKRLAYRPRRLLPWMLAITVTVFIIYTVLTGGLGGLYSTLLALRGGEGSARTWSSSGNYSNRLFTFSLVIDTALNIAIVVTGDLALNKRVTGRARQLAFCVWAFSAGFYILLGAGARSLLALAICAPLSLWLRLRLRERGAVKLGRLSALVISAVFVLWFSSWLRAARTTGFGSEYENVSLVYHDDIDFVGATALSYKIYMLNGEQTYDESQWQLVLFNPVPRWLWPNKPESKVVGAYSYYDWGIDIFASGGGGNSLPGMVGQALLSGGWSGIALMALAWGVIAALGDAAIRDEWNGWPPIAWSLVSWWFFTAFRAIGPSFFAPAYLILLAVNGRRFLGLLTHVDTDLSPASQSSLAK